jgi:hypothetical protein
MARLVFVLGKSGTGKTTSMRNLKKDEVNIISATGKELPFKNDITQYTAPSYNHLYNAIEKATAPIVVIDDANYFMSFEEMNRVQEVGYNKFTQMAQNFFKMIQAITSKESDQTFYVMAHSADTEDGHLQLKTTGKLLSEKIVLEGLTNIVIASDVTPDNDFVFRVKTDGTGVKSPLGMFNEPTVPNDLKEVNKIINDYYRETK